MKTKPLNNNVLIEVMTEHSGVSQASSDGSPVTMNFGKLIDFSIVKFHLTASASAYLEDDFLNNLRDELTKMKGGIVRWEEFAEGGQTFEEDGKTYALIPWWRLIGYKETE
jgi:hypothetical protein